MCKQSPRRRDRQNRVKEVLEKVMAENFPKTAQGHQITDSNISVTLNKIKRLNKTLKLIKSQC